MRRCADGASRNRPRCNAVTRTEIVVPLLVRGGEPLGALDVDPTACLRPDGPPAARADRRASGPASGAREAAVPASGWLAAAREKQKKTGPGIAPGPGTITTPIGWVGFGLGTVRKRELGVVTNRQQPDVVLGCLAEVAVGGRSSIFKLSTLVYAHAGPLGREFQTLISL